MAETFAVTSSEMRCRSEAARYRYIQNGAACTAQQITTFVETKAQIILPRRLIEMAAEQSFQLPGREMNSLRQLPTTQRVLEVIFHHLNSLDDLSVGGAKAIAQILPRFRLP